MSVKKNFIYNIVYQILIMILPLITAPYIARTLGDEKLGIFSYTYSVAAYFALFAILGLNNYGNRTVAKIRANRKQLSTTFWEIFSMQASLGIVVCIVYILYVVFLCQENKAIAFLQLGYVIADAFNINWLFFGLEKFKLTVTRNIIIKICSVLAIFLFVKSPQDIYLYTVIMMGASVLSQAVVLWPFVKKEVDWVKPHFKGIIKHTKPNLVLFIPVIAVSIYKVMDKIMLGNLSTMSQVAYYEYGEKIITISVSVITALGTVMLPQISFLIANGKKEKSFEYIQKSMAISFMASCAMAFGIAAIADDFAVWFYGADFAASGSVMKGLAVTTIFISLANVVRTQYLIPTGKDKIYIISVIMGAVINLVMNGIFIPKYQANGAVIGTVCAEFVVMIYQMLAVRKELPLKQYFREGSPFLLIGAIMFLVVKVINCLEISQIFLKMCLEILSGACVYIVVAMFYLKRKNKKLYISLIEIIPFDKVRRILS